MKKNIIILSVTIIFLLGSIYAYAQPNVINTTTRKEEVTITNIRHQCIVETNYHFGVGYVEEYENEYKIFVEYRDEIYELQVDRYTYEKYYDCEGMIINGTIEILDYSDGSREYDVVSIE